MPSNSRYERLVSGSDLRGVALAGYGREVNFTPEDAAAAAFAFAAGLSPAAAVAVGRDPRLSGPALLGGVARGLAAAGRRVIDCGIATTPSMFFAARNIPSVEGAIMLTASHLPPERNGMKFFTRQGGLSAQEVRALTDQMRPLEPGGPEPQAQSCDLIGMYAEGLRAFVARDLSKLRIAVDAGNGSGGFFAKVLQELGASVVSLFPEPDGRFPNHAPNPEDAAALEPLQKAVVEERCDLGVIFDADCDRAALVDRHGEVLHRDRLIALVAAYALEEHPGSVIVTDSVTSTGLARFIEERGGAHRRFKRGYRHVIDEARRLDAPVAIETSGHCALRENHYLDDGMYLAAWLLRRFAGEPDWEARLATLQEPAEDVEIRLALRGSAGPALLETIEQGALAAGLTIAPDSAEGVRVFCPEGGWFMARVSVHDPVLPVNFQADAPGGAAAMALRLYDLLKDSEGVDLSPLRKLAGG